MQAIPPPWLKANWSPTGLAIMIMKHLRAQYVVRRQRPPADDCTREINRQARMASGHKE